jgi:hypothetical protein
MGHCAGGVGPVNFGNTSSSADPARDVFTALEQWVEKGVAPNQLIGSGPIPRDSSKTMTRPSQGIQGQVRSGGREHERRPDRNDPELCEGQTEEAEVSKKSAPADLSLDDCSYHHGETIIVAETGAKHYGSF